MEEPKVAETEEGTAFTITFVRLNAAGTDRTITDANMVRFAGQLSRIAAIDGSCSAPGRTNTLTVYWCKLNKFVTNRFSFVAGQNCGPAVLVCHGPWLTSMRFGCVL